MVNPHKSYFRVMLGRKSAYADLCRDGNFIGGDWGISFDLSAELVDDWRQFNAACIPKFLEVHPEKSKVAAGLACGALHTICKGARDGMLFYALTGLASTWSASYQEITFTKRMGLCSIGVL